MLRLILLHKEIKAMNISTSTSNMNEMSNEQWLLARQGTVPITLALCFALGWQGGTIHQVAAALQVSTSDILNADSTQQGELLRKAQAVYWQEHKGDVNMLLFKHLRVCLEHLQREYIGHYVPSWLERAAGVAKILGELFTL